MKKLYYVEVTYLKLSVVHKLNPIQGFSTSPFLCYTCTEFNYTFKWVDDHKYGKRDQDTGEWNGMVGELLAQVRRHYTR